MRGNSHAPFGNRPTEKDPNQGHLAGGRVHSTGGDWHGATYATGQSSTLPLNVLAAAGRDTRMPL